MKLICFIKEIWRTLTTGLPFDGHDYVDVEEHENCTVTISKCEICGKVDISWIKTLPTNK